MYPVNKRNNSSSCASNVLKRSKIISLYPLTIQTKLLSSIGYAMKYIDMYIKNRMFMLFYTASSNKAFIHIIWTTFYVS